MLETLAQAVVNGLLIGGIYALVSIGVTLIFGVVKIVNFAQGEFVMIGMYISFFLATYFGIDPLVSLAVSMPVLFIIGILLQHFLIRRVLGLGDMPQIFLTFALSLLLMNLALMAFTANYRTVHTWYSDEAFHLGEPAGRRPETADDVLARSPAPPATAEPRKSPPGTRTEADTGAGAS